MKCHGIVLAKLHGVTRAAKLLHSLYRAVKISSMIQIPWMGKIAWHKHVCSDGIRTDPATSGSRYENSVQNIHTGWKFEAKRTLVKEYMYLISLYLIPTFVVWQNGRTKVAAILCSVRECMPRPRWSNLPSLPWKVRVARREIEREREDVLLCIKCVCVCTCGD